MELTEDKLNAFRRAEGLIAHRDFCPYLELKTLLTDASEVSRARFCSLFSHYYGMNAGGLTDEFKTRYFQILFNELVFANGQPRYGAILEDLSRFPGKNGHSALHFSFVSKLVAIHDETKPIYDRHVLAFFNVKAPASSKKREIRTTWYVDLLTQIAADYARWGNDPRVKPILDRLRLAIQDCNNVVLFASSIF